MGFDVSADVSGYVPSNRMNDTLDLSSQYNGLYNLGSVDSIVFRKLSTIQF